jgi:cytochrome P450
MTAVLFDPLDEAVLTDPYPVYRQLRDGDPVHHHDREPEFWALSRFADVWQAVREPETFASAQGLTFWPDEIARLGLAPTIVMMDPPRQTQLRALVGRAFTPRRVQQLEATIRAFVGSRIEAMEHVTRDGGEADLHRDFSSPIPTFVLATLLGVPEADRAQFDPWVAALVAIQNDGFRLDAAAPGRAAVVEMFAYFGELIGRRRAEPGDDLISALTQAEVDGERLADWDILGFCFVMVAGGNDTTGNLISHAVTLLDAFPSQRALLLGQPELLPNALIECLRLEGSVQGLARTTTRPVTLHGVDVPAGAKVLMLYGSANRDEREFGPTADVLDVTRHIPRHLSFSSGPHFCIGNHLAQLQARVALEELLRRQPGIGADVDRGRRLLSSFTRGWSSLPAVGIR